VANAAGPDDREAISRLGQILGYEITLTEENDNGILGVVDAFGLKEEYRGNDLGPTHALKLHLRILGTQGNLSLSIESGLSTQLITNSRFPNRRSYVYSDEVPIDFIEKNSVACTWEDHISLGERHRLSRSMGLVFHLHTNRETRIGARSQQRAWHHLWQTKPYRYRHGSMNHGELEANLSLGFQANVPTVRSGCTLRMGVTGSSNGFDESNLEGTIEIQLPLGVSFGLNSELYGDHQCDVSADFGAGTRIGIGRSCEMILSAGVRHQLQNDNNDRYAYEDDEPITHLTIGFSILE
jgi:hypothetical protein